jgi:hypothetical protein
MTALKATQAIVAFLLLIQLTLAASLKSEHSRRIAHHVADQKLIRESDPVPTQFEHHDRNDQEICLKGLPGQMHLKKRSHGSWYGPRPTPNRVVDADSLDNDIDHKHPGARNKIDTAYLASQFNTSYYDEPVFWEGRANSCPAGNCGYEIFPFLKNPRSASYCEDRCWNSECLGRSCPGCDRECPNIFQGCSSDCFSEACISRGDCGSHCQDCGKFMQFRWEKNLYSLRDRMASIEGPLAFDKGFKQCENTCKRPAAGCEVCFETPKIGCSSCLERPTPECETCVKRQLKRSEHPAGHAASGLTHGIHREAQPGFGMKAYESHGSSSGPSQQRGGQLRGHITPNDIRLYDVPQHEYIDAYRGLPSYDNYADRPYEAPYDYQREFPFVDRPYRQNFNGPNVGGNPGQSRQSNQNGSNSGKNGKGGCPHKNSAKQLKYPPYVPSEDGSCGCSDTEENDEQIVVE